MKKLALASFIVFAVANHAAMAANVLLEKVTYPGFVMQSYAISTQCQLMDNGQIMRTKQLGGLTSNQVLPLKLSVDTIKTSIKTAALGKITIENAPVDMPTISYRAYQKQSNGKWKQILLWEQNGGSGENKTNDSTEATTLKNFININCDNALSQ